MPGSPSLFALSLTSDPAADELPVVGIAALIVHVEIEESGKCKIAVRRQETLSANGDAWQMRYTTKEETGQPYTLCRVDQWKGLVVGKAIEISCQALPQSRDSITGVDRLAAISRIGISVLGSSRKYTDQKAMKSHRSTGASEDRGARDAEFKIGSWFERELFSINEGLVLQGDIGCPIQNIQRLDELRSGESTYHYLGADGTKHPEKARQFEGTNAIISNHVD